MTMIAGWHDFILVHDLFHINDHGCKIRWKTLIRDVVLKFHFTVYVSILTT